MKKDTKKVNAFIKMAQSKKPDKSKNVLAKEIAEHFGVGLTTAKRWITDYQKENPLEFKVVKSTRKKDNKKEDEIYLDNLTDEQIYDEIKGRLLNISRTAQWEKDVIAASKELIRLMSSPEYKKAKEKKKEKPTMKEVGLVMSSIFLGVNPDTIEEFKKIKKVANE